jgi:hypothetical protein
MSQLIKPIRGELNRRNFLITASAGFALAATGLPAFGSGRKRVGNWIYDFDTYTIGYSGPANKISGQSMYSQFKDAWMNDPDLRCYSFPCMAVTREMFLFDTDWRLEDSVMPHIVDASIRNGDDVWQGVKILGSWTDDFRLHRDELPNPVISKEESFCYKAEEETNKLTLLQSVPGSVSSSFEVYTPYRGLQGVIYFPLCQVVDNGF